LPAKLKSNFESGRQNRYSLQLFNDKGEFVKEVMPFQSFSPGLQTISIPREILSGGFGFLALTDEEAII
jgi:hypothetical protein